MTNEGGGRVPIAAPTKSQQESSARKDDRPRTKLELAAEKVAAEIAADPTVRDCTLREARIMIAGYAAKIVHRSRSKGNRAKLTDEEIYRDEDSDRLTRSFELFNAVMPDGANSRPGSAHEAIEAFVLKPNLDEYALIYRRKDSDSYRSISASITVEDFAD